MLRIGTDRSIMLIALKQTKTQSSPFKLQNIFFVKKIFNFSHISANFDDNSDILLRGFGAIMLEICIYELLEMIGPGDC